MINKQWKTTICFQISMIHATTLKIIAALNTCVIVVDRVAVLIAAAAIAALDNIALDGSAWFCRRFHRRRRRRRRRR